MIDSYINIDKSHKSFDKTFVDLGLQKLVLKDIANSNQINLVVTSLAKYGNKKNLSDFESTNRPFPTLIIVDDQDFEQTIDLIQNPLIELMSSKSEIEEVGARIHALVGDNESEILEFKDLLINLKKTYDAKAGDSLLDLTFMEYELLKFFVENQDNVWSREQLLEKVWGYDYFGGARTVDVHVEG